MAKRKRTFSTGENKQGIMLALGVFSAVITGVILAGVLAFLIVSGRLPESGMGYGVIVTHFVAGLIGSLIAGAGSGQNGFVRGGVLAAVYMATLIAVGLLFFDGIANPVAGLVAVGVGALLPPVLQMATKRSNPWRKRRYSR